jgi:AraC family transcriptional regulator
MILSSTVSRAVDYILLHLTENVGVDDVASFCGYSKFYFSRMFKAETGQSVYSFIRRIRVEQCAFRLKTEQKRSITDISIDYGYTSSNFSTLFLQLEHETPYYFRKGIAKRSVSHPFFHAEQNTLEPYVELCKKISIEVFPDYTVIFERHIGNYHELAKDWCVFLDTYKRCQTHRALLFERTFDDPSIADDDRCIFDICMQVENDSVRSIGCPADKTELLQTGTLAGGKFAVYHFKGRHQQIFAAYQNMFNVWIPESGAYIDDRYGFDIYRKVNEDASYMEIDLCIPVR